MDKRALMTWLYLEQAINKRKIWVNSNNICTLRSNIFEARLTVVIHFEVDQIKNDLGTTLKEIHVNHTLEEIMTMIDKPALLAQLIGDPGA
jgi:hypothetical protein